MSRRKQLFDFLTTNLIDLYLDNLSLYGGDFPTTNDELAGLVKFGAFDYGEPEQVEKNESPKIEFTPTVQNNVVNTTNIYNQPITIIEISNDTIQFPKSNLPIPDAEEQDGQTATKVTIGAPITLSVAALGQNYGQFTYNPLTEENKVIKRFVSSDFNESMKEEIKKSTMKYIEARENIQPLDALDSITYLFPSVLRGNRGKLSMMAGACPLRLLSQYYSGLRNNTHIGVQDEIPQQITFEDEEITYDLETKNPKNFKVNDSLTLDNTIGDLLDSEIDWCLKLKEFADKQINAETKENVPVEANSISEAIFYLFAVYYNKIGLDAFPNTVPETMTQALYDDKGNALEPKTIDNLSVMDFLLWQFKAIDELVGRFPIDIQIEDNDLIQVGDQPVQVKLPNIAETLGDLAGKAILTEAKIDALLPITLKNLAESGSCRQQAIKNYYLVIAIQEYLGFRTKQKITEIDLLFNPKVVDENELEKTLAKALETSSIPMKIEENDDKNTLEGQLSTLVESARIIKAHYWQKLDANGDMKQQIIEKIKRARDNFTKKEQKDPADFDFFIQCFEQGFEDFIPGGNLDKPFGKPFENRPKMRKYETNAKSNTSAKPSI